MKTLKLAIIAVICFAGALVCPRTQAAITVIDYYRLGEADAGAANNAVVNATSQDSAGTNHLKRMGSPAYTNAVAAAAASHTGSQLAVSFNGSGQSLSNGVVSTATDNFGIEAWARPNLANSAGVIAYNGNTATSGWGFFQNGTLYSGLFGGHSIFGTAPVTAGVWTHLAVVRDGGTTTLYVNGAAVATDPGIPGAPSDGFGVGQPGQTGGSQTFNGQIDEVRVFTFLPGQFSTNDLLLNASTNAALFTMKAALQTDVNGNTRPNPGDTLRYTVVITNNTGGTLSNLVYNSGAVSNAPQVGGSLKATPLARVDAPTTNSAPGNAFHGALNTTLNIPAVSGLLSNDFLGLPAAQIASFGGGSFPGTVTATAAGATANAAGIGALTVNADGSVTFTPNATFNGLATFQYRLANSVGTNDTTATFAIGTRPGATSDSFNVTGNTLLDTSLIPAAVLGNDAGSAIGISGNTAPGSGSVTLLANGSFRYTPNAGFTGADSFTYTITNGFGPATATVNLTIANKLWYIDGASVAGTADGRSSTPFKTILAFNGANDGGAGHPGDNDTILIRDGNYTDGIALRVGQKLVGDGSSGTLATALGFSLAAGSAEAAGVPVSGFSGFDPIITSSGGHGLTLNANNTIRGITVGNTPTGTGFFGGAVGTLNISESSKIGTGGAITIGTSGSLNVSFDTLGSTNATGAAIALVNCSGTFSAASGGIVNPIGSAIFINGASGPITYPGSITKNNAGRLVDIQNRTGGSVTLSGDFTQSHAAGTGINVATNASSTITFSGFNKLLNISSSAAIIAVANTGSTVEFTHGGFELDTTSGTAISISGGGTFNMNGFANTVTTASGTAFLNTGIGGSATIDINAELAGAGRLIDIQNRTGGTVTLSGDLNNPGTGMLIQNNSGGGTITLSGETKTFSTGANTAVNLANNTGTTINLTGGGLALTTTTGTGFNATGGATAINVTGSGNTISSGNGTALNVVSTTIGASGLTFRSISSSGGSATGIILNGTGANAGLTVTGTGSASSGGTIASKTGADGSTTTGIGIYLNSTTAPSFSWMQLNDFQNYGIYGTTVNGFNMTSCTISGVNGTSAAGIGEGSVYFTGLSGSAGVTNCSVSGAKVDNFHVFNDSAQTLNRIFLDTVTLGAMDSATGNDGLAFQGTGGTLNVTVRNSTITSARGDLFQINMLGTLACDLVFTNNALINGHPNIVSGGGGVTLGGGGVANNVTFTYNVSSNIIRGAHGATLAVFKGTGTGANFIGTIARNVIGIQGVAGSGSTQGDGIAVFQDGAGTIATTIFSNHISGVVASRGGIDLLVHNGASGQMSAVVQGNTIDTLDQTNAFAGIYAQTGSGTGSGGDNNKSCWTFGGAGGLKNNIDAGANSMGAIVAGIVIEQEGVSRIGLLGSPNYSGGVYNDANVQTYVGANTTFTGNNAQAVFTFHDSTSPAGGGFFGSCPP